VDKTTRPFARHARHADSSGSFAGPVATATAFCCAFQQISKDRLEIQQGSLYPALYRLEHQGWITSEWGESENKRKAKYYRLTAAGKRRFQTEAEKWNRMTE